MGKMIQYSTKEAMYNGPFDSVVGWSAAGMGYVFVTDKGKLIVVDGGLENDAEDFLKLLMTCSKEELPVIDLWIITHPHLDHYGAVQAIAKTKADQIFVKRFIYWFPKEFQNTERGTMALEAENQDMEDIAVVWGAEIEQPYRDMKIAIDEMKIEFLYVPDDCSMINNAGGNANCISLIFTVEGKSKKAMITGDAFPRTLIVTDWRYGENLKCDYLQMPHHGLCDTGNLSFYQHVDASELFVPISKAGDRTMHSDMYSGEKKDANLWAEANAQKVHKAFEGTVEVEM